MDDIDNLINTSTSISLAFCKLVRPSSSITIAEFDKLYVELMHARAFANQLLRIDAIIAGRQSPHTVLNLKYQNFSNYYTFMAIDDVPPPGTLTDMGRKLRLEYVRKFGALPQGHHVFDQYKILDAMAQDDYDLYWTYIKTHFEDHMVQFFTWKVHDIAHSLHHPLSLSYCKNVAREVITRVLNDISEVKDPDNYIGGSFREAIKKYWVQLVSCCFNRALLLPVSEAVDHFVVNYWNKLPLTPLQMQNVRMPNEWFQYLPAMVFFMDQVLSFTRDCDKGQIFLDIMPCVNALPTYVRFPANVRDLNEIFNLEIGQHVASSVLTDMYRAYLVIDRVRRGAKRNFAMTTEDDDNYETERIRITFVSPQNVTRIYGLDHGKNSAVATWKHEINFKWSRSDEVETLQKGLDTSIAHKRVESPNLELTDLREIALDTLEVGRKILRACLDSNYRKSKWDFRVARDRLLAAITKEILQTGKLWNHRRDDIILFYGDGSFSHDEVAKLIVGELAKYVRVINPEGGTSQLCSRCFAEVSRKTFHFWCSCGVKGLADKNGASNIVRVGHAIQHHGQIHPIFRPFIVGQDFE